MEHAAPIAVGRLRTCAGYEHDRWCSGFGSRLHCPALVRAAVPEFWFRPGSGLVETEG